ncbi:MAG: hypothetical protein WBF87_16110 [Mesorhizobium sp.]
MTESKPWYLSRTIWASVVAVAAGAAGLTGFPTAALDHGALVDTILQFIGAGAGLIAIFGRLSASRKIG